MSHFSPLVLLTFYLSARSVSVTLRSLKLIFQVWSVVNTQSLISYHMLRTHSKIVYLFMYLPLLCLFGAVCFLTEAALSVHRCSRSSHLFFYFSALNFFLKSLVCKLTLAWVCLLFSLKRAGTIWQHDPCVLQRGRGCARRLRHDPAVHVSGHP